MCFHIHTLQVYESRAIDLSHWEIVMCQCKIFKSIKMIDLHMALIDAKRLPKTHVLVVISCMHYQHMSHRNGHASLKGKWKIYQYAPLAYKVLTCNCPLSSKGQHKSTNVVDLHISQWRRTSFQWHKCPKTLVLVMTTKHIKNYISSPNIKFTKFSVT